MTSSPHDLCTLMSVTRYLYTHSAASLLVIIQSRIEVGASMVIKECGLGWGPKQGRSDAS